jgi:putative peptide zinc metalloprotease protein
VRKKSGLLYPERAAYRVVLHVLDGNIPAQNVWRGHLSIAGEWAPPALRLLRSALSVVWRESGF